MVGPPPEPARPLPAPGDAPTAARVDGTPIDAEHPVKLGRVQPGEAPQCWQWTATQSPTVLRQWPAPYADVQRGDLLWTIGAAKQHAALSMVAALVT